MLVSSEDKEMAREYEVKFFPSLGLFRNGDFVRYTGDLMDEFEVLEWLTARYRISFILCPVQCEKLLKLARMLKYKSTFTQ